MPENKNIRCEEVVDNLLAFLDREIDEERKNLIERHLEECRSCCSRADFELALRHRVREAASKEPPVSLRKRIGQIIDKF